MHLYKGKAQAIVALIVVFALAVILGGCGSGGNTSEQGSSQAEEAIIKLAHESPATHPKGVWAENFKKLVEEKSGGNIKVELYHQGQLYASETAALEAVRNGMTQMGIASTGYISGIVPEYEIIDLPMLFPDTESFYKFQDGEIGQELLSKLTAKGYTGLGYITNVPLDAFTKDPLVEIADFSGKKLRTHTATIESSVKALGGNPISMAANEVFMAMEQGMLEGMFTTVTYAAPNKLYEVAPHMTNVKISAIAYPIIINSSFWDKLSEDQQNTIKDAVDEAMVLNREELKALEEESMSQLKEGGIQIHELTPEQRAAWIEKLAVVYEEVGQRVGQDMVEKAQEFVANNS